MPDIAGHHRKTPRQARSLATVGVILDAAALVLVDEGYERATTNRIAERAGVSIGSLYQYFPNRDALVGALSHRTETQLSDTIWRALSETDGLDLRGFLGLGLQTAVNSHARVLPLLRILLEMIRRPVALQWPTGTFPQRQAILREIFIDRGDELRDDFDVEAGSFLIPRMVGSAIDAAIIARPDAFANGELERELTTMLSYYLTGGR
jgi:AcrR family transcriptional regulator